MQQQQANNPTQQSNNGGQGGITVTSTDAQLIDTWIAANGLNQYGDAAGTVYSGGTPLFNEQTGESIGKYEYVITKHPDRPWTK